MIDYSLRVIDNIRLAVVDAFFSLPRGGAEIGGILLGRNEGRKVTIVDHLPLDCEHATGPSFVLSANDHSKLAEMLASARGKPGGIQPVGWYHSHTRSEIHLSTEDLEIHRRYFPEPWQIAIVLKPHTFQPTNMGIFFREADGSIAASASYREVALQPLAPAAVAAPAQAAAPPKVAKIEPQATVIPMAKPVVEARPQVERSVPTPPPVAAAPPPSPMPAPAPVPGPVAKAKPVEALEPAKKPEVPKRVQVPEPPRPEPAKKPDEPRMREEPKPVEQAKPVESPKVVDPPKPVEPPKMMEPPKTVEPPKAAEPPEIPAPAFTGRPASRPWGGMGILIGLIIGLLGGGLAYQTRHLWMPGTSEPSTARTPYIGLSTMDTNGQLQIRWDRESPAVRGAEEANLAIEGGPHPEAIQLDPAQLRSGSFTYGRQSERVDVALTLRSPSGQIVREKSTYLGKLPDRSPSLDEPAGAKPPDDEAEQLRARNKKLEKTVDDLRQELRKAQKRQRQQNQIPDR